MKVNNILSSEKFKNTFIYIALNIVNNSVPFFILPILIIYLSPKDLGLIGIFNMAFNFFKNIIGLGSLVQIQKMQLTYSKEKFSQRILVSYLIAFFVFLILFSFLTIIPSNLFEELKIEKQLILFSLASSIFWYYSNQSLQIIQQDKKAILFSKIIISVTILNFAGSYLFLMFDFGYYGRIFGIFVAQVFSVLITFTLNKENIKFENIFKIKKNEILEKIKQGLSFIPFLFGNWCNKNFQKLVILSFVNIETFGLYSFGLSISRIVSISVSSLSQSLKPFINEDLFSKKQLKVLKSGIIIFLVGIFFLIISIYFIDLILLIFDKESKFSEFKYLYVILMFVAFLESITLYFKNIFIFFGRKKYLNYQVFSYILLLLVYSIYGPKDIYIFMIFISIYFVMLILFFAYLIIIKMPKWNYENK